MLKQDIVDTLQNLADAPLRDAATRLLNTLGYHSERTGYPALDAERWNRLRAVAPDKIRMDDWHAFHILFQISDTEINREEMLFEPAQLENDLMLSYIFVAVKLAGENWTRTQLADITRFINTQIVQPIMVMFHHGDALTLAIINRRWDRRERTAAAVRGGAEGTFWRKSRLSRISICAPRTARIWTSSPNSRWIASSKPKRCTVLRRCTKRGKTF